MIFFETERLVIKTITPSDYNYFVELLSDLRIIKPIPQPIFPEDIIMGKFNKSISINIFVEEPFAAGVFLKEEPDEMIGLALFLRNEDKGAELGYRFRFDYWGQGYATELTKGMLSYYFESLEVEMVTADVNIENIASVKILQKFMKPIKEFFNPRDNCTDRQYGITHQDWIKQQNETSF